MATVLTKSAGLVFLIVLGFVMKKIGMFKVEDSKVFSKVMIYITLPAILINAFRDFQADLSLISLFFINIIVCLIMTFVGWVAGRKEDPVARAMYMLCAAGFNVGSFGLPFIQAFFPDRIMNVVMFDIGNSITCCGLIFSFAVMQMSKKKGLDLKLMGKTLVGSFPFDIYVVLLALQVVHFRFPEPVYAVVETVAAANPVVVMVMLGILFEVNLTPKCRRQVVEILTARILGEVVLCLIIYFLLPMPVEQKQVLVMLILGPCTSMVTVFCGKLECDSDVYGTVSSLSIAISIAMMIGLGLIWAA